jgi:hypothetical protein
MIIICCRCKKKIAGNIKVDSKKKSRGKKSVSKVDYYCEKCFKQKRKEGAMNEYRKQKADCKKTNKR